MSRTVPTYIWVMLLLTGCYLTIEIPFSVHLVRILGGVPTQQDIDSIERFGRLLTGIAVALAFIGIRTYPKCHVRGIGFGSATFRSFLWFIPIVGIVYGGLHYYGEARGLISTGEMRKEAFLANLAKRSLAETEIRNHDASSAALISSLPGLYSAQRLVDMTGLTMEEMARREAVRTLGTPDEAHSRFASDIGDRMRKALDAYWIASSDFKHALSRGREAADAEWAEFRREVEIRFDRDPAPGSAYHKAVVARLHEEGVEVPRRFRLSDRRTFTAAFESRVAREASAAFREGIEREIGNGSRLVPGLDERRVYADPGIQRLLREELDISPPGSVIISPHMSAKSFSDSIYPALVKAATDELVDTASKQPGQFTTMASSKIATDAMKAATLPATALLLSLAGALFHIYKFCGYAAVIGGRLSGVRLLSTGHAKHAFAAVSLVLAVIGMRPGASAAVDDLLKSADGGIYASILGGAIRLQPGMELIGTRMADAGPWKFIEPALPLPKPVRLIGTGTRLAEVPVPQDRPMDTIAVAVADRFIIPIPEARPMR